MRSLPFMVSSADIKIEKMGSFLLLRLRISCLLLFFFKDSRMTYAVDSQVRC